MTSQHYDAAISTFIQNEFVSETVNCKTGMGGGGSEEPPPPPDKIIKKGPLNGPLEFTKRSTIIQSFSDVA